MIQILDSKKNFYHLRKASVLFFPVESIAFVSNLCHSVFNSHEGGQKKLHSSTRFLPHKIENAHQELTRPHRVVLAKILEISHIFIG